MEKEANHLPPPNRTPARNPSLPKPRNPKRNRPRPRRHPPRNSLGRAHARWAGQEADPTKTCLGADERFLHRTLPNAFRPPLEHAVGTHRGDGLEGPGCCPEFIFIDRTYGFVATCPEYAPEYDQPHRTTIVQQDWPVDRQLHEGAGLH